MKFALIDGKRREPQPKLTGHCPSCGEVVTAKCGTQRVWHWAHKGRLTCDPWWEPEGEWHRAWKNQFPVSWQEIPLRSKETGELHIADIRTPGGLVIEFQHSAIDPAEQAAREAFYGNMLWVVDGTRLKRDRPQIDRNLFQWWKLSEGQIQTSHFPDEFLPARWLERTVPVLFDFGDDHAFGQADPLLCLLADRFQGQAVYFTLRRATLTKSVAEGAPLLDWHHIETALMEQERQRFRSLSGSGWRRGRFR